LLEEHTNEISSASLTVFFSFFFTRLEIF
jgi:hypothetical protein